MRMNLVIACLGTMTFGLPAVAADNPNCKAVHIGDLGWTDIALTNASAEVILTALGYETSQTLLGLDVTFLSLKTGDLDVFQGNWRPVQDDQYKSYFEDGSVEVIGVNLKGAKFTLAVPKYVSDAGVTTYADLAAHTDEFGGKIYAIEPGSNQPLLDMVAANRHGLGEWKIVESSEAGMLAQVRRAVDRNEWVAFLGWAPHPMNLDYDLTYLDGGDIEFGPNFGGATVRTLGRKGYAAECPNVAKFFANLVFDIDYESIGMQKIMAENMTPADAAIAMIKQDPARLDRWLDGVTGFNGDDALPMAKAAFGL